MARRNPSRPAAPDPVRAPPFLLRMIGGAFFAFAVTESYLAAVEDWTRGPQDYDDLAAVLAAGFLGGGSAPSSQGGVPQRS
jgi:hypothetical protein